MAGSSGEVVTASDNTLRHNPADHSPNRLHFPPVSYSMYFRLIRPVVHPTWPPHGVSVNVTNPRSPSWCSYPARKVGYTLHICKSLVFLSGAVATPVFLRYDVASLGELCRTSEAA
jgi:hypothetical protein